MFKYCFVNKKKVTFLRNSNYFLLFLALLESTSNILISSPIFRGVREHCVKHPLALSCLPLHPFSYLHERTLVSPQMDFHDSLY